MGNPSQIKFIRGVLYSLKQSYGEDIDYYRVPQVVTDYQSGVQTEAVEKYKIKKVIRLPSRFQRDFDYDITYLAANKNFTYGGLFDKNKRSIIIDKRHWPKNLTRPEIEDYVIIDSLRYNVKEVIELDLKLGFLLIIEYIEGTPLDAVQAVTHVLKLTQVITGVKA